MMAQEFYSNGKLLLSGEYGILDGAEGWAVPTKFGQRLTVTENATGLLSWSSRDADTALWFEAAYTLPDLEPLHATDEAVSKTLRHILQQAKKLNPGFLARSKGCSAANTLTFPRNWGLGTSSTLVNNMAQWAQVDPYSLLNATFGGSGYDIACARHNHPILFKLENHKPVVQVLNPELPFSDHLYFVYLNQKKNSRDAIAAYRARDIDKTSLVKVLTGLTHSLYTATTLTAFETFLDLHENTLSTALNIPTIKEQLFPDYTGSVKSLGGWGGDFVMVTGSRQTLRYFREKGFGTILSYAAMVL